MYKITLNNLKNNLENSNENINKMLELGLIKTKYNFLVIENQKALNFIQFKFGFLLKEDWTKHLILEENQESLIQKMKDLIDNLEKTIQENKVESIFEIIKECKNYYKVNDDDFFGDYQEKCIIKKGEYEISDIDEAQEYWENIKANDEDYDEDYDEFNQIDISTSIKDLIENYDEFQDFELFLKVSYTDVKVYRGTFTNKEDAEKALEEIKSPGSYKIRERKIN